MPKLKLTKRAIEAVPQTEKGQVFYTDSDLPGFYLIVGQCVKTFAVQKDIRGKSIRYTIGRYGQLTPENARKIAQTKLFEMAQGLNPNILEREQQEKNVTLDQVFNEYLDIRKKLKPRTRKDYRDMMDLYLRDWLSKRMEDITKQMIAQRHAKIARDHGPYPANKIMRILRALFNYAIATYDTLPANPVLYLTHVKAWFKEERRRSYIQPSQLGSWWKAVNALENNDYRDFLILLLFTGLRRNEASTLRWEDINIKDQTFTIRETKNGDPLTLPISTHLLEMFENRKRQYGNYEFVFPGPGKLKHFVEPKKGIKKVIEMTGINFTCHDLRRTFITIAEGLDVSAYALKRLINHRVTDITGGYIIVDVERLRKPTQQIETFILGKVHGA